jgi:hypothetical protein
VANASNSEEQPRPAAPTARMDDDSETEMAPEEAPEVVGEARPSLVDDDEPEDDEHERPEVAELPEAAEPGQRQERVWRNDAWVESGHSEDERVAHEDAFVREDGREPADLPEPGETADDDAERQRSGLDESVAEDADRGSAAPNAATTGDEHGDAAVAPQERPNDERDGAPVEAHVEPGSRADVERGGEADVEPSIERDIGHRDDRHLVSAENRAHLEHDKQAPPDQPVRHGTSEVTRVGQDDDRDSEEARRRGWWQRFVS